MTAPVFYPRWIAPRIAEALLDTPVVLLAGPRQAGKTTLVRQMAGQGLRYLTLDDELTLMSAREDPVGMIRSLDRAVIDEIQRAPGLLLAIKKSVDEDRRPGRFLLTGSANLMALPAAADSLAGRMETLSLLPLSQSEIEGHASNWVDCAFAGRILATDAPALGVDLVERVLRGGYPEAVSRASEKRRVAWARAPDRWSMIAATDFLARSFTWQWPGLAAARGLGLAALQALPPVKSALARQMMFGRR